MPLALFPSRVVEPEEPGWIDPESRARELELFDAHGAQILDGPDRRMRPAGFAIRGARQRDSHATFAEVGEHTAVENLIVGMGQHDEHRRLPPSSHDASSRMLENGHGPACGASHST